jgi:predicted DCC family thiol-disulfide oxidoreductase YuxK
MSLPGRWRWRDRQIFRKARPGHCVCNIDPPASAYAKNFAFRLTTAQSPLGQALFRHYGLDTETFETNLVLADGRAHAKLDTVALVGERLGGGWRAFSLLRLLPRSFADWLYDRVARNRYALFGRTERCMIPPPEWRDRFID